MENKYNQLDENFKKAFEDFEVSPRPGLWGEVKVELDTQSLNKAFVDNFADFEVQPEPKIWENLEKHLPLNLFVKRHLHRLSKIAAVLLFIMVAIAGFMDLGKKANTESASKTAAIPEVNEVEVINVIPEKQDFVFQLESQEGKKKKISRKRAAEIKRKKRMNKLWNAIMEDKDDFVGINAEKIKAVLAPIERLPLEDFAGILEKEAFKNLPANENTDETAENLPANQTIGVLADQEDLPNPEDLLKIWIPQKITDDYDGKSLFQVHHVKTEKH